MVISATAVVVALTTLILTITIISIQTFSNTASAERQQKQE